MNAMQEYINEQPRVFDSLLKDWDARIEPVIAQLRNIEIGRIILFGSGSSYHAAVMAAPLMARALKVEVTPTVPTRLPEYQSLRAPVYFAISQGGRSTNTFQMIDTLQAQQIPVVAVTESNDTPVAQKATCAVALPIGEETIGAKTKGVTASAVTLMLIGLALGEARGTADPAWVCQVRAGLQRWQSCLANQITAALSWSEQICPTLAKSKHLYILAKGMAYGGALEGGLKILETAYRPVSVYEFEEYLHGVQNALDDSSYMICIDPYDDDRRRLRRLMDFAEAQGAHCFLITGAQESVRGSQDLLVQAPDMDLLESLNCLPALQTLAAQLSAYCGIDVTRRKFPDFFARMESKLEL